MRYRVHFQSGGRTWWVRFVDFAGLANDSDATTHRTGDTFTRDHERAKRAAEERRGKVVRILSAEEAKQKAQADTLRKSAARRRADALEVGVHIIVRLVLLEEAKVDEGEADLLWPAAATAQVSAPRGVKAAR